MTMIEATAATTAAATATATATTKWQYLARRINSSHAKFVANNQAVGTVAPLHARHAK